VLTVTTTAATSALDRPAKFFWPSAGGTALALVCLLGIPARRRRNWMAMLGLVVFFASIAAIGCGGGGGSGGGGGGGGNTGTTAGNYTITVTGSGAGATGTITQTTPVTLTVQ
jgi:peptidoglycan/LPS O-acetylase OafA/YrhL